MLQSSGEIIEIDVGLPIIGSNQSKEDVMFVKVEPYNTKISIDKNVSISFSLDSLISSKLNQFNLVIEVNTKLTNNELWDIVFNSKLNNYTLEYNLFPKFKIVIPISDVSYTSNVYTANITFNDIVKEVKYPYYMLFKEYFNVNNVSAFDFNKAGDLFLLTNFSKIFNTSVSVDIYKRIV
jgi:hypothetical protein